MNSRPDPDFDSSDMKNRSLPHLPHTWTSNWNVSADLPKIPSFCPESILSARKGWCVTQIRLSVTSGLTCKSFLSLPGLRRLRAPEGEGVCGWWHRWDLCDKTKTSTIMEISYANRIMNFRRVTTCLLWCYGPPIRVCCFWILCY